MWRDAPGTGGALPRDKAECVQVCIRERMQETGEKWQVVKIAGGAASPQNPLGAPKIKARQRCDNRVRVDEEGPGRPRRSGRRRQCRPQEPQGGCRGPKMPAGSRRDTAVTPYPMQNRTAACRPGACRQSRIVGECVLQKRRFAPRRAQLCRVCPMHLCGSGRARLSGL